MKNQSPDFANQKTSPSSKRRTFLALGIGFGAQYSLTHGFPLLGMVGYWIAIWLFLPSHRKHMDYVASEGDGGLEWETLQEELKDLVSTFKVVKNNWRQITLSEIFAELFKAPDKPDDIQAVRSKNDVDWPNN